RKPRFPRAEFLNCLAKSAAPREELVAPVAVARAAVAPERGLFDRRNGDLVRLGSDLLERLRARPDADVLEARVAEVRLDAVHGLLDPRLFLALEQRMVLAGVPVLVVVEQHRVAE